MSGFNFRESPNSIPIPYNIPKYYTRRVSTIPNDHAHVPNTVPPGRPSPILNTVHPLGYHAMTRHMTIGRRFELLAESGRLEPLQMLYERHRQELAPQDKASALDSACRAGHLECVKYLVEANIVSATSVLGNFETPLSAAVHGGHMHIVKYLVEECKVDPRYMDCTLVPIIGVATTYRRDDIAMYLISKRLVDPALPLRHHRRPLTFELAYLGWTAHLKELVEQEGLDVNEYVAREFLYSLVAIACYQNDATLLKYLVEEAKADVDLVPHGHAPPLHLAVENARNSAFLGYFLKIAKPEVDILDADGHTPLCRAVAKRNWDHVKALVSHGADPNHRCLCRPSKTIVESVAPRVDPQHSNADDHLNLLVYLVGDLHAYVTDCAITIAPDRAKAYLRQAQFEQAVHAFCLAERVVVSDSKDPSPSADSTATVSQVVVPAVTRSFFHARTFDRHLVWLIFSFLRPV